MFHILNVKYKARPSADEWESLEKCPLFKNDNTLREYQLEGLNWLSFCYFNKWVLQSYVQFSDI